MSGSFFWYKYTYFCTIQHDNVLKSLLIYLTRQFIICICYAIIASRGCAEKRIPTRKLYYISRKEAENEKNVQKMAGTYAGSITGYQ